MSKANLLLVDDDTLVLQSLSLSLEDEGYSVATAASGKEAIALCHEQTFEVSAPRAIGNQL
jgi:CheY-like chemotaxis protein